MTLKDTSQRMLSLSARMVIYVVFTIGIIVCAKNAYTFGKDLFSGGGKDKAPGHDYVLSVVQGESEYDIAKDAADLGIVKNARMFFLQMKMYMGKDDKIAPGNYTLNSSKTGEELVEILITPQEQ